MVFDFCILTAIIIVALSIIAGQKAEAEMRAFIQLEKKDSEERTHE